MSFNGSSVVDQASFLRARDPSIWGWENRKRFVAPVRKHLNEILEDEDPRPATRMAINTYLRLKPPSSGSSDQVTFSILNESTVVTHAPKDAASCKNKISGRVVHQYTFTKVFGPMSSQEDIFDDCVAYQVKDLILGNNCLLFAYGTTNAGKTFTIQGNGCNPGIIPRALDLLFRTIQGQVASVGRYKPDKVEGIVQLDSSAISQELEYKNRILNWNWDKPLEPIKSGTYTSPDVSGSSETDFISNAFREMQKTFSDDSPIDGVSDVGVVYGVWVSFAEVYNENVYDLLDPIPSRHRKRIPLKLAQDSEGNVFIRELKMIHVASGDEAFQVMLYGKKNLQVAATNMNLQSSRSHCIFSLRLVRYANSDCPSYAMVSTFTFCDLAGAERAKKTLNVGDRLKESNNINTSLHVLGRCLSTIRENQRKGEKKPVPFRDSKLTRIFQRALTGHERITLIVNANTSPSMFDETMHVLNFSAMAKQIVLETPIKRPKPAVKKSRFSLLVSRPNPNGTICWDAPAEEEEACGSVASRKSSETVIENYNAQNEELLLLVEKLKEQLAQERKKSATLESRIREEVTDTYSKVISNMEDAWKARLKDVEERTESLSTWRIAQLENYYKQELENTRKRRRKSSVNDSVVECTSPEKEKQVQELQDEIQLLEEKCSAVHQLLKEAQGIQLSLSSENSSLKFEIANLNSELEKERRQMEALLKQQEGNPGSLVEELQCQLSLEKENMQEEMKKNASLKELLEEAKQDFLLMQKEKEEVEEDTVKLQEELLEKDDELANVAQLLEETQTLVTEKSREFEKLEEKFDALGKTHDQCEEKLNEISLVLKDHDRAMEAVETLQRHLQCLSMDSADDVVSDGEGGASSCKTLLSVTNSLADLIQSKFDTLKATECALVQARSQLNETVDALKAKDLEVQTLNKKVECLENELRSVQLQQETCTEKEVENMLQEKLDFIDLLENEKKSMVSQINQLKDELSTAVRLREEEVVRVGQQQAEIKLLQKDLKDMLQKNIKIEEQLKESISELSGSQDNCRRLELELKSVLQKSSTLPNMSSSQIELESLRSKEKSHEETIKFFREWKEEAGRERESIKKQLKESQEENERWKEELKSKEIEIEKLEKHRTELINRYEEAYKKVHEELEREKREVISLRDAFYKSTPTPKKNESAEIRQLKDRVETLQTELNLQMAENQLSAKKPPRSAKKVEKQEFSSSNESFKENVVEPFSMPSSASKSKKTSNASGREVSRSSSRRETAKESSSQHLSQGEQRPQRRNRKLFSMRDALAAENNLTDVEIVEDECARATTPDSFVKRSLRNRKV